MDKMANLVVLTFTLRLFKIFAHAVCYSMSILMYFSVHTTSSYINNTFILFIKQSPRKKVC